MGRGGSYNGGGTLIGFAAPRGGEWTDRRTIPRHQRKKKTSPPALPGPKWKLAIVRKGRKRRLRAPSAAAGRTIPWVKGRPATEYELALFDHVQQRHSALLIGEPAPKVPALVTRKLGNQAERVIALLLRRHRATAAE